MCTCGLWSGDPLCINSLEVVSKPQIAPKIKARADEKAQHTWEYVSILKRFATQIFGVRWDFETTSINRWIGGGKL